MKFLQIARGSLFECQTQIEIGVNLKFLNPDELEVLNGLSLEIEKMLNSLINKLAN